jgi:hypothetical protein
MLATVNPAQKGVTLAWIAVILLAALVPFAPALVILVLLVAAVLTFAAAAESRLRAVPLPVRPALAAIRTSQHLPRAALPRLGR